MNAVHNLNLFWFRHDLRLKDNHGLYQALSNGSTICCFIWDIHILQQIRPDNPRIYFIHDSLMEIKQQLQKIGSDLKILYGDAPQELSKIINEFKITQVFCNEDYEPAAITRDNQVKSYLEELNINFYSYKDQVIFAKREILNQQGRPYTIYTPYKNSWYDKLQDNLSIITEYHINHDNFVKCTPQAQFFNPTSDRFTTRLTLTAGSNSANQRLENFLAKIENYEQTRDFPDLNSTSYLGVDLRFGTISIRYILRNIINFRNNSVKIWLNELIWREFFSQILFNFPHVVNKPFRQEYQDLAYQNNPEWFIAWCEGNTGYPIVDAGMRQLNTTGFMHNRVRMICASFLCKDLLIDWRWGEKYFANKLLDYDLASNNGNWQWCASTGCDAQPYFRIFNPALQSQKFDPNGEYIRKYIPELSHLSDKQIHLPQHNGLFNQVNYPAPIVNHHEQIKLAKLMFNKIHGTSQ